MLEAFLKYVAGEARVILDAPLAFMAALLVTTTLIYLALRWRYAGVISNLEERVKLRDDRLTEYREKLHAGTPDEAKARIEALETRIAQLAPRRLTKEQSDRLAEAVRLPQAGKWSIQILNDISIADSAGYANQFCSIFEKTGWRLASASVLGPAVHPPSGLAVLIGDANALSEAERLVIAALKKANIEHDAMRHPREQDVGLLIT